MEQDAKMVLEKSLRCSKVRFWVRMKVSKEVTKIQFYDPYIWPQETYKRVGFRDKVSREFLETSIPQKKKTSTKMTWRAYEVNLWEYNGHSVSDSILRNLKDKIGFVKCFQDGVV